MPGLVVVHIELCCLIVHAYWYLVISMPIPIEADPGGGGGGGGLNQPMPAILRLPKNECPIFQISTFFIAKSGNLYN